MLLIKPVLSVILVVLMFVVIGLLLHKFHTPTPRGATEAPWHQVRIDCDYGDKVIRFVGWIQRGTVGLPSRMVRDGEGNWLADVPTEDCFFQPMDATTIFRD